MSVRGACFDRFCLQISANVYFARVYMLLRLGEGNLLLPACTTHISSAFCFSAKTLCPISDLTKGMRALFHARKTFSPRSKTRAELPASLFYHKRVQSMQAISRWVFAVLTVRAPLSQRARATFGRTAQGEDDRCCAQNTHPWGRGGTQTGHSSGGNRHPERYQLPYSSR